MADLFDGNAYYWSSGDPLRTPGAQEKLRRFATVVHAHGGLWFAPASPGFDARLVGGTRVVPRRGGATLRASMNAALAASPDAVALISWNEYSENTMVEPSTTYGSAALKTLVGIEHADPGRIPDFDWSAPSGADRSPRRLAGLAVLGAVCPGQPDGRRAEDETDRVTESHVEAPAAGVLEGLRRSAPLAQAAGGALGSRAS